MKLFQIEEPDGSTAGSADGIGAAVGFDLAGGAVAVSVGGNPEILRGEDETDEPALSAGQIDDTRIDETVFAEVLLRLKMRAERSLGRPVTHGVVVGDAIDEAGRAVIVAACARLGLVVLGIMTRDEAALLAPRAVKREAAILGAALKAEDQAAALAPRG